MAQTETITINGTNDDPTVAAVLTSTAAENDASYNLNLLTGASDVDNGETATLAVSSVTYKVDNVATGSSGTALPAGVTLSGHTLTVDPTNAAFNSLAVGEHKTIVVSYNVVDVNGGFVAQTETITINGTNDVAQINAGVNDINAKGSVTEDTSVTSGHLIATNGIIVVDPDSSQNKFDTSSIVDATTNGAWGSLSITESGTWTYSVDNTKADLQALKTGEKHADTFTVKSVDGTATKDITVDVNGKDEPASYSGSNSNNHLNIYKYDDPAFTVSKSLLLNYFSGDNISFTSDSRSITFDNTNGMSIATGFEGTTIIHATSGGATADVVVKVTKSINMSASDGNTIFDDNSGNETTATGSAYRDIFIGSSSNEIFNGNNGNDIFVAKGGNDTLTGGAGSDWFILDSLTGKDTITDFVGGTDLLQFSKAIFNGITTSASAGAGTALDISEFISGAGVVAATNSSQHFIYNQTSGELRYDADGNGLGNATVVALIGSSAPHPGLTAQDIHVIV